MKIRRRPERWRLRLENSNLPVESLFPLFQRGNRLREQAVRGLKFFFQAPALAVPKIFCGIRLEYFDRGAKPCSLHRPQDALRRLCSVSFGYKRNGVVFMLKRADNIRPYVMKAFSKKQRHVIAKCLCCVFNYFCSSSIALRRISFA